MEELSQMFSRQNNVLPKDLQHHLQEVFFTLSDFFLLSDQLIKKFSGSSSLEKMSNKPKVIQGIKVRNEELQMDKILCK